MIFNNSLIKFFSRSEQLKIVRLQKIFVENFWEYVVL